MSIQYHPTTGGDTGLRKVQARLAAMTQRFAFSGARVLDLGCSGGFFSFALAKLGAEVLAIDGDGAVIKQNQREAVRLGLRNVEFRQAVIDPDIVRSLGTFDVTLFLSVLHHLIASSNVYGFNAAQPSGVAHGRAILSAIGTISPQLFFEIGQDNESHEWAAALPRMRPSPAKWIEKELLRPSNYEHIDVIPPPEWAGAAGFVRKLLHSTSARWLHNHSLAARVTARAVKYDTRDCRVLFFARTVGQ